jgi:hypothetical protein
MRPVFLFALSWCVLIVTGISGATYGQAPTMLGRASCAAATCHGGVIGQGEPWKYSLTHWAADDPHVGAGLVLKGALTESIVLALDPRIAAKKDARDDSWTIDRDALLRKRCISCHVTATAADCDAGAVALDDGFLAQGVSCESCHGAASQWIDEHYTGSFTAQLSGPALGMRDTETMVGRADGCVRCHVGSRSEDGMVRDMNHDIIAAGHPVLRFDFLLYEDSLPRHWDVAKTPEFYASPVRLRSVGRAMTLSAASALAGQRAADHAAEANKPWDQRQVPWPEFSDYDCFACHQSLSIHQYLLPPSDPKSELRISDGLPIWNSWHTVGQEQLTKNMLQALSPRQVDPAKLAAGAAKLADSYKQKAQTQAGQPGDAATFLAAAKARLAQPPRDWHEAAILYLDIDAALRELSQQDAATYKSQQQALIDIQPMLQFSSGLHSPARFNRDYSTTFRNKLVEALQP